MFLYILRQIGKSLLESKFNIKLTIDLIMEVRVYNNTLDWSARKSALVKRVESCSDILFPFDSVIRSFKALYGDECVIEFVCT